MIINNNEMGNGFDLIVPGGLNTDITGMDVNRIVGSGELTLGGMLKIGPGGKAGNMARMCSVLLGEGKVAMIGRTVKDPYGLWQVPVKSLESSGVCTDYLITGDFDPDKPSFPGVAMIPVDKSGNNQIYVLPGANADFSADDIKQCRHLFEHQAKPWVLMAMEIPFLVIMEVLKLADSNGLKVIIDPGGVENKNANALKAVLNRVYLIKPNEYEAEILSGVKVSDFSSAERAAKQLLHSGVRYVFITHGEEGGYLFGEGISKHIPVPAISFSDEKDSTGCGDQVTATLVTALLKDYQIDKAAELAITAGTLQFGRHGVVPVSWSHIINNAILQ